MDYLKRMPGLVRKALQDFGMIKDGDCVAVGLSGGKDSMTMLSAMKQVQRYYPRKFELKAIYIDLGYGNMDVSRLEAFCQKINVPLVVVPTNIGEITSLYVEKGDRPCSICANLRRGALNNAAEANGCNVVALAHTKDDVVETMLMCLFREGRISTFSPVTELTRTGITVIRPLIFADETEIIAYMKACGYEAIKNSCPHDGFTERTEMRLLLENMAKQHPDIKNTIFGAIRRSKIDGWNPLV